MISLAARDETIVDDLPYKELLLFYKFLYLNFTAFEINN